MSKKFYLCAITHWGNQPLVRAVFGALMVVFLFLSGAVGFQQEVGSNARELVIRGAVVNDRGYPVPNTPVRLIFQRVEEEPSGSPLSIIEEKTIETKTDGKGRYEIIALIDPYYNRYLLSFYSENQFDSILYTIPPNEDISSTVFKEEVAEMTINKSLRYNPRWPEIKARIEELGDNSDQGRILRLRGMPDRVESFTLKKEEKGELWWYYSKGFCYRFVQGKMDKLFCFSPISLPRKG